MSRGNIITYGILILLVMFFGQSFFHQLGAYKEKIAAAETERKTLVADREQLLQRVAELTAAQTKLQGEIQQKETALLALRQDVTKLEEKLKDERSEIVRLQTDDDSIARFRKEFPEFSLGMRMVERQVPSTLHPEKVVPMNYIMLPVGFVDHFIELKKTAINFGQQNEKLNQMDALNIQVKTLEEKIIQIGRDKEAAYHKGYEEAFAKYMELSQAYVAVMKEKRLSAGTTLFQAVGAFVGGVAIGAGLK